jgi:LPPG:FO 2-phospho-L-lactate transferase
MLDVVGEDLTVIANTGDDIEIYGAHVSPDPDLIAFWLADRIDERGWGLRDDTFEVMEGLRELGQDVWFNLGDRDLAVGLYRKRRLNEGARLTEATAEIARAFGVHAQVLPMSDEPIRTHVQVDGRWIGLQEYLIRTSDKRTIESIRFEGADRAGGTVPTDGFLAPAKIRAREPGQDPPANPARPTPETLEAIATAQAIVIGPSNPIISIGPILALPGMQEAIRNAAAPVVAVSPLVKGQVLKGPTAPFMAWAGHSLDSAGIADAYAGLLDGLVADERTDALPVLETSVLLATPEDRRRVAEETLRFAGALSASR